MVYNTCVRFIFRIITLIWRESLYASTVNVCTTKWHTAILAFFLFKGSLLLLVSYDKKEEKRKVKKLVGFLGLTALCGVAAISLTSCGNSGEKFGSEECQDN